MHQHRANSRPTLRRFEEMSETVGTDRQVADEIRERVPDGGAGNWSLPGVEIVESAWHEGGPGARVITAGWHSANSE